MVTERYLVAIWMYDHNIDWFCYQQQDVAIIVLLNFSRQCASFCV